MLFMASAFMWGAVGGLALIAGALLVFAIPIGREMLGSIMAFGAGVLISAVAFELFEDAVESTDGYWAVAAGLFGGAVVFYLGDKMIDSRGGRHRKSPHVQAEDANSRAILLGTVLDAIPESIVIGVSLLKGAGVSAAMVTAVCLSNLPESIASSTGLRASGWSKGVLLAMWTAVTFVSGLASLAGYALLDGAADETIAFTQSFAAGALLTMLSDEMIPKAFELEGKLVGVLTTAGFAVAFAIGAL